MKQTLTKSDFIEAFRRMDRYDQFGYEALSVLFDYFEECDPDMELDVIAICCDYSVDTFEKIAENYGIDLTDCTNDDDIEDAVRTYLDHHAPFYCLVNGDQFVYCSAF